MKAFLEFILSIFKKPETPKLGELEPKIGLQIHLYKKETEDTLKEATQIEISPVEFKGMSSRLSKEYSELTSKNLPLKSLVEDLNIYVNRTFKKKLMLTMIFRTEAEQDFLYADNEKYKKKKFKSPHQFWQAVDIRSKTFTDSEVKQLEDYLNDKWNKDNYYKWTAKNHTVGHGMHFHIQFVKK